MNSRRKSHYFETWPDCRNEQTVLVVFQQLVSPTGDDSAARARRYSRVWFLRNPADQREQRGKIGRLRAS